MISRSTYIITMSQPLQNLGQNPQRAFDLPSLGFPYEVPQHLVKIEEEVDLDLEQSVPLPAMQQTANTEVSSRSPKTKEPVLKRPSSWENRTPKKRTHEGRVQWREYEDSPWGKSHLHHSKFDLADLRRGHHPPRQSPSHLHQPASSIRHGSLPRSARQGRP